MKTKTKGNVIVENIKVGDILYEYGYGQCIKSEVITKPFFNKKKGGWEWKSKKTDSDAIIDYFVNPEYPHYAPNLYDYKAYKVKNCI